MAVKLRLTRVGKKKKPMYRVVVADERAPRDGRFIEIIGQYQPQNDPSVINIKDDRALYWLSQGAQPTDTVHKILTVSGVWDQYKKTNPKAAEARDIEAKRSQNAVKAEADKREKQLAAEKAAEEAAAAPVEASSELAESETKANDNVATEEASSESAE